MIERVSLFASKTEIFFGVLLALFLFLLSLSWEFYSYKQFTRFDSTLVSAKVLKQYEKTKLYKSGKSRTYQVLKLKSSDGLIFYTTAKKDFMNVKGKILSLEIWAGDISFYEYLRTFYAFSKVLEVHEDNSLRAKLSSMIQTQHSDAEIANIYEALYLANPLEWELQKKISTLGISHLIAISGFHLGVLSGVLFFLIKYPYKFFQNRYFPHRSFKCDSFIFIALMLFWYLLFLESPPSLLRAFGMFIIGFILYDRGIKIISMQTLFVSVILLLSLSPKLVFALGFWLSVGGVFYIFLFLIYFKEMRAWVHFFLLPLWIYIMMLPYSLALFGNFSLLHPLSILWTSLFVIFYPLSLALHLIGFGDSLDFLLHLLLELEAGESVILLEKKWAAFAIGLSALSLFWRYGIILLLIFCSTIFIHSVYNIAEF